MDIFNEDFQEFITALNNNEVEYILVGGYSVILHEIKRKLFQISKSIQRI